MVLPEPGSGDGPSQPAPILWGRQTFTVSAKDKFQDKTSFFASLEEGPEVLAGGEQSALEIMTVAKDGVLPLAAAIKIAQGYQEAVEDQVAILLAGGELV